MNKVFQENKELVPITHKEFNEFIKGFKVLQEKIITN